MAGREDCLWHPESAYFLKIYPHVVDVFGGDVCCAALVQIFAFLTNSKLTEYYAAGEDEALLWVRVTPQRLAEFTAGLYSWKRIQERVAFLLLHKIIRSPTGQPVFTYNPTKPLTFILNRGAFDQICRSGKILSYKRVTAAELPASDESDGSETNSTLPCKPPANSSGFGLPKPPANSSGLWNVSGGVYKEEEEKRIEEKNPPTPFEHSFEENREGETADPEGQRLAVSDLLRRLKHLSGIKMDAKGKESISSYFHENPILEEEAFRLTEEFAGKEFWKTYRYKGAAFIDYIKKNRDGACGFPYPPVTITRTLAMQPTPESAAALVVPETLPALVLRWNEQMPESTRVKRWNGHAPKRELAAAEQDQEFVEEFPALLDRCQQLAAGGRHIDFGELFEQPKFAKSPNWYLILHHRYPYGDEKKSRAKDKPASRVDAVSKIFD